MCNLYSNTMSQDAMRQLFSLPAERDRIGNSEGWRAIYPRYDGPVLRLGEDGERELLEMHWGFVMPQASKKTGKPIQPRAVNNARDDKLRSSGFWKSSFQDRRCLIPATSFCEAEGRQPATYHWFGVDARAPFCLAGIWKPHRGKYKDELADIETYSMVTTTPNEVVAPIHPDRMPAILDEKDWNTWLSGTPEEAFSLIAPFDPGRMAVIDKGEDLKSEPA